MIVPPRGTKPAPPVSVWNDKNVELKQQMQNAVVASKAAYLSNTDDIVEHLSVHLEKHNFRMTHKSLVRGDSNI